ncbi:hypothetical protein [Burkholderia gladioli]|uniref:hypothetical protein n=1 Tax=Burkholderia gladioli TaxID=28095 RepID=UPI001640E65F|nr:hypothetical protein [Burkholderia gladioli]
MLTRIDIIKCRAVVGGEVKHWIMATDADGDNEAKARRIFEGERLQGFVELARAIAEAPDADPGVFAYVTAEMSIEACIAWANEMCDAELQILRRDSDAAG